VSTTTLRRLAAIRRTHVADVAACRADHQPMITLTDYWPPYDVARGRSYLHWSTYVT
jgi:hypothetical protein